MIVTTSTLVALAFLAQAQPESPPPTPDTAPALAPEAPPVPESPPAPAIDDAPGTPATPPMPEPPAADVDSMLGPRGSAAAGEQPPADESLEAGPAGSRGSDAPPPPHGGTESLEAGPAGARGGDAAGGTLATGQQHVHVDVAPQQLRATPAVPVEPKTDGHWRITLGVARQEIMAESNEWIGDSVQAEGFISLERNLGDLIPVVRGLGVRAGLNFSQHVGDFVGIYYSEAEIGVSYHFPHDGLWDVIYPYAHLDFLAAWAMVETGTGLEGDEFVPGFGATLGLRFMLPRMGASQNVRIFALFEGGWQLRATVVPRLTLPPTHDDPEPEPPIPLGNLDMLGFNLRFGAGIEF